LKLGQKTQKTFLLPATFLRDKLPTTPAAALYSTHLPGYLQMESIEGFILAGGQSRRMGTDKSRLNIGDQTFVERIAQEVAAVAREVRVVGATTTTPSHLATVPDVYPKWGALGGVHAALSACAAEWALVIACDFPLVTSGLFNRLADLREGFDAVAPIQSDEVPQPLCALYRVAQCLVRAESLIKSGERRPIALLQSVETRWVRFDEIASLEGAAHFFDNINTPEDYAHLVKKGL
jgi:molybdopterin-guanine dinucleotide biosynthesis protein A